MLQQFTWQEFLIAAVVLSLVWYTGVLVSPQLKKWLGKKSDQSADRSSSPLPHRWEKGVEVLQEEPSELMGKAKLPEGVGESFPMAQVAFVQDEQGKEDQVGLIPDVLAEIRKLFAELERSDGNKRDFFSMMEKIRSAYPRITSSPHLTGINDFIVSHAPFHLSAEELENLWD